MKASVTTYGGELRNGTPTVKHWQFHVNGQFVGDTSEPPIGALFEAGARIINEYEGLREKVAEAAEHYEWTHRSMLRLMLDADAPLEVIADFHDPVMALDTAIAEQEGASVGLQAMLDKLGLTVVRRRPVRG